MEATMKCVQNLETKEIKRLSDKEASVLVKRGWSYITTQAWKNQLQVPKTKRNIAIKAISKAEE